MKVAVVHGLSDAADAASLGDAPDTVQSLLGLLSQKGHSTVAIAADDGVESVLLQVRSFAPDVVFNLTEGARGPARAALYPALFADLRVPCTGSDAYSLGLTVDKAMTKLVARENGVPVPQGIVVTAATLATVRWDALRYPVILKPTYEDYSRGILQSSVCRAAIEAQERVRVLLQEFDSLVVEEFVFGSDVVVAYLEGAGDGVLPPCEVVYPDESGIKHRDLVKGNGSGLELRCPAALPDALQNLLKTYVRRLARALGLRDFAQFDFRVSTDGVPFLLEVNGLPSLRPGSPLFVAADRRGLAAVDVVGKICEAAARRKRAMAPAAPASKERKAMRVGFVYNLKRTVPLVDGDHEAEWDPPKTINAIRESLERQAYSVVMLEATETLPQRLSDARVDVVFNIAEGYRGRTREAQVPALCDMLGIPHTGSDATSLAVSMDKALTKDLFLRNGVPTPNSQLFRSAKEKIEKALTFPLIVKPNAEGSSKGIRDSSVVMNEDDLRRSVKEALGRYNQPVLVEQYVTGREFTVALMQTDTQLRVLPPLEVVFLDPALRYPVYSFEIKQDWDKNVRYDCPAQIDKRMERLLGAVSRKAFQALGCRDYARVDFRVSAQGVPYVLEVNPLPGLTPNFSDMCLIANASGISYDDLIGMIVKYAIRRMRVRGQKPRPALPVRPVPTTVPVAATPDQTELPLLQNA